MKINTKKPRGKISEDVILCIITTIMDFPHWSGRQRMEYLNNKSGILKGVRITIRSVNRLISNLNFEIKTIKFTPPARNSIGLMYLRAFWARIILEIAMQPNVVFMFVDEAAVTYLPNAIKGRALIGVVPVVEGNLSCKKLSILACVIPVFGVISRWFDGSIKGKDYATFIREVADLIRRAICTGSCKLCLIHDNCSIHKTSEVREAITEIKLNEFPTVPYSPQLNEVVEAYFGFQKKEMANYITKAVIFDQA